MPDSLIETIQSFDRVVDGVHYRARPNGCIYPEAPSSGVRMASGTRVKATGGAFTDLVGSLSEMSDGKRVKVLLEIMGKVPVVMPQAAVEVVG